MRSKWGGLRGQFGNAINESAKRLSKFKYGNVKDGDARKTIAGGQQGAANSFES